MKSRRILGLALVVAAAVYAGDTGLAQNEAALNLQAARGGKAIPDHYIVVLKDGASAGAVAARHGVSADHVYSTVLNGFAGTLNRGQLQRLLRDPDVQWIDEDGVVTASQLTPGSVADLSAAASSDVGGAVVQPGATWGIDKLDQLWGGGTNGSYNYTNTGLGVNVYIFDTGIRYTHNEFDGAALNRAKKAFDVFGGSGADCHGHGTHVAGTVGGTTYGVAKAAKLYSVRVLDCGGSGSWADFITAVEWVTANHLKPAVANASLGGGFVAAANAAVEKSVSWGVTWVVAAGNSADNACNYSPASAPSAITVGATDINNNFAGFSNWGPCVDISGPGVAITSSWWTSDAATAVLNGTSMASPHVAGLAALYHQTVKTATPGQVTDAVEHSGVNGVIVGEPGGTPDLLAHKINDVLPGSTPNCTGTLGHQEPDVFNGQCYYFSNNAGWHHVWLRGSPGTNFNVEFYQWNGSAWIKKAQKITGSTNEYLKTFQPGGFFYMYVVKTVAGGGTYDSWNIRPS